MSMSMVDDPAAVHYPDSDGEPMAENARQALIIRTLILGFERLYAGRADVWVGGDCFWYPVEGDPRTVTAPDVIVVAGLPAPIDVNTLGSYRQWEHSPAPLLVVEVLSPSNTAADLIRKLAFYDQYGVREYWLFDPDNGLLQVYWRDGEVMAAALHPEAGWVSPATGVHLRVVNGELVASDPGGGRAWRSPLAEAERADAEARRADAEARRADAEAERARALEARVAELERRLGI